MDNFKNSKNKITSKLASFLLVIIFLCQNITFVYSENNIEKGCLAPEDKIKRLEDNFEDWFVMNFPMIADAKSFKIFMLEFESRFLKNSKMVTGIECEVKSINDDSTRIITFPDELVVSFADIRKGLGTSGKDFREKVKRLLQTMLIIDASYPKVMVKDQSLLKQYSPNGLPSVGILFTYSKGNSSPGMLSITNIGYQEGYASVLYVDLYGFINGIGHEGGLLDERSLHHEMGHLLLTHGAVISDDRKIGDLFNDPKTWENGIRHYFISGLKCNCRIMAEEEERLWSLVLKMIEREVKGEITRNDINNSSEYKEYIRINAFHRVITAELNEITADWLAEKLMDNKELFHQKQMERLRRLNRKDTNIQLAARILAQYKYMNEEGSADAQKYLSDNNSLIQSNRVLFDNLFRLYVEFLENLKIEPPNDSSRVLELGNSKVELTELFSSGYLLREGIKMISKAKPDLNINNLSDISRINSRVTNFDISLLPLLSRIPRAILSDEDWGIYQLSAEGIEYRAGIKREIVPFSEKIRKVIIELIIEGEEAYFSDGVDILTRAHLTAGSQKIAKRGAKMMRRIVGEDSEKINAFISASELDSEEGPMRFDMKSVMVILGLLERVPDMLNTDILREHWYWIPREEGIEFINKINGDRELVEYSSDIEIISLPETARVKEILNVLMKISANSVINSLDELALYNESNLMTEYDKLRFSLEQKFEDYFPITYDHYLVHDGVARRSGVSNEEVVSYRFALRELHLTYAGLNSLPRHLLDSQHDNYSSYRPRRLENFTQNYPSGEASFVFAPLAMREAWMLKNIIASRELADYLGRFDDEYLIELSYIRIQLHEKAHRIYHNLSDEQKRAYAEISWDVDSWNVNNTFKKRKEANDSPEEHFMITYPLENDNSEEDFVDHITAYILFGPQFREDAKRSEAISKKYEFIKNNVFGGVEYNENYNFRNVVSTDAPSSGQMKHIGKRDYRDEDTGISFSEAEKRELVDESLVTTRIDLPSGEKAEKIIASDDRLKGLASYHFDLDGEMFIAVNGDVDSKIREEGEFHEIREVYWMQRIENGDLDLTDIIIDGQRVTAQHAAHIIASAEQIKVFAIDIDIEITPYHLFQLQTMTPAQLKSIQEEKDDDRIGHHTILEMANNIGAGLNIPKIKEYEANLRKQSEVRISWGKDGLEMQLHTDIELAKKGMEALVQLVSSLPPPLAHRVQDNIRFLRVYSGVVPEVVGLDNAFFNGLDPDSRNILINAIESNSNYIVVPHWQRNESDCGMTVVNYSIFNIKAVLRVMKANPNYFPKDALENPTQWLRDSPGKDSDHDIWAIRYSLINGHPWNAAEKHVLYLKARKKLAKILDYHDAEDRRINDILQPQQKNLRGDEFSEILRKKVEGVISKEELTLLLNAYSISNDCFGDFIGFDKNDSVWATKLDDIFTEARQYLHLLLSPHYLSAKKDINYAKTLLDSLIVSKFSEGATYRIKYDKTRLSETQEAIIKEYIERLKKKVSNPNNIKALPFMGTKRDYVVQIEHCDTHDQVLGKGQVNIEGEDILQDYPLQIVGILNIALAGSHIVFGSKDNDTLMGFIKEQYKDITGKELAKDEDVRNITLPKPKRMDLNEVDRLNNLSLDLLISA